LIIVDAIIVFGLAIIGYAQFVQYQKIDMLENIVGAILLDMEEIEGVLEEMLYDGEQNDT